MNPSDFTRLTSEAMYTMAICQMHARPVAGRWVVTAEHEGITIMRQSAGLAVGQLCEAIASLGVAVAQARRPRAS